MYPTSTYIYTDVRGSRRCTAVCDLKQVWKHNGVYGMSDHVPRRGYTDIPWIPFARGKKFQETVDALLPVFLHTWCFGDPPHFLLLYYLCVDSPM